MKPQKHDVPRPPARLILTTPEHLLAFGFGAGLAPVAPGTFGTLVGIPFYFALCWLPWQGYAVAVITLFAFGCWICGTSARLLQVHDYPGFVFDEIVGFLIACAALLPTLGGPAWHPAAQIVAAFVLFRVFDIAKPWPIRIIDRHVHGGFGIMLDDAVAGVFAGAALWGLTQVI